MADIIPNTNVSLLNLQKQLRSNLTSANSGSSNMSLTTIGEQAVILDNTNNRETFAFSTDGDQLHFPTGRGKALTHDQTDITTSDTLNMNTTLANFRNSGSTAPANIEMSEFKGYHKKIQLLSYNASLNQSGVGSSTESVNVLQNTAVGGCFVLCDMRCAIWCVRDGNDIVWYASDSKPTPLAQGFSSNSSPGTGVTRVEDGTYATWQGGSYAGSNTVRVNGNPVPTEHLEIARLAGAAQSVGSGGSSRGVVVFGSQNLGFNTMGQMLGQTSREAVGSSSVSGGFTSENERHGYFYQCKAVGECVPNGTVVRQQFLVTYQILPSFMGADGVGIGVGGGLNLAFTVGLRGTFETGQEFCC